MRNKLLKKEVEKGREDMENGRLLDEPVFDHTHEAEILKAENKAFGVRKKNPRTLRLLSPKKRSPKKKRASSHRSKNSSGNSSPKNHPARRSSSAPKVWRPGWVS